MCTVTVVPHAGGVRVLCNRDEQRARPLALPPHIHHLGGRVAVFPIDPRGGGTWIGVNDTGLVVALLNVQRLQRVQSIQPVQRAPRTSGTIGDGPTQSRGHIVRLLLHCASLSEAMAGAENLDPRAFELFRVVIVHNGHVAVAASRDGESIRCRMAPLIGPLLFTSSSLGDALVDLPRRRLFARMVIRGRGGWLAGQTQFHQHQWPHRREISVRMERGDALTVSRTTVDVSHHERRLLYEAPLDAAESERARACCSLH